MNGRRLSVRDYKKSRRNGPWHDGAWLRPFITGLAIGLAIAVAVFVGDHRSHVASLATPAPQSAKTTDPQVGPRHGASDPHTGAAASTPPSSSTVGTATATAMGQLPKYDFYQMLPRPQVLVPGRETDPRLPPDGEIDRPGIYFLQIGSYRDAAVADHMRAQAQKLGVTASVQKIVVDTSTWHRVRVGPIRDLVELNRIRHQLQSGKLEALVVRVVP